MSACGHRIHEFLVGPCPSDPPEPLTEEEQAEAIVFLATLGETTHLCPPGDKGIMPCCGRTPFEVSPRDRLTLIHDLVNCPGFVY